MLENHKRIFRNTGMLYIRMLLVMAVTLYTSRVVLAVLGVEDFGLYHVVAGFVALLGFMQGAMARATQRYFAFDLGDSGGKNLNLIFNTSLLIHGLLVLVIVILAETAGYWFVVTQLTIPDERMFAAIWAYHLTIASFAIGIISVPFISMLMAHEKMGIFAFVGILDVLMKLGAVIVLQYLKNDKLISYAVLLLLVSLFTFVLYLTFNKLLFKKINFFWYWNPDLFNRMVNFIAWNAWGNFAVAVSNHGSNLLLNIFFGPAVNAGRVISMQANSALTSFVTNVQSAINPQIFKLYAKGDKDALFCLVRKGSKYNFYLLVLISMPVLINLKFLLSLWLVEVPPYTEVFLKLIIIASLIESLSGSIVTLIQSSGNIAKYQVSVSIIIAAIFPAGYLSFSSGYSPEVLVYIAIFLNVIVLIVRLIFARNLTGFPVKDYLVDVLYKAGLVFLFSIFFSCMLQVFFKNNFISLVFSSIICLLITCSIVFYIGLTKDERKIVIGSLRSVVSVVIKK